MAIVESIRKQLDASSYTVGILVDFKKAFETVDHNILTPCPSAPDEVRPGGFPGQQISPFPSYASPENKCIICLPWS